MADQIDNVLYEEEFIRNSNGSKLFTCKWLPTHCEPKALIFLCHSYATGCSISMKGTAKKLAKSGFAVYGMDYIGHGKSSGLQGYVPSFEALVDDCSAHFTGVAEKEENKNGMRILLGESMGGAVVLMLHMRMPEYWDGAVLLAPMCRIADEMLPSPWLISAGRKLSNVIPTWKVVPSGNAIELSVRDPEVREFAKGNPLIYKGPPRLKTAYNLLDVTMNLEKRLGEVSLPFIVLHGEDDKVTSPSASKLLFEKASSTQKSIKLYPGMWHALAGGELPENIEIVHADIVKWLNERTAIGNSRAENPSKE